MTSSSRLREGAAQARRRLAEMRARIRAQHDRGAPGIQICAQLADMFDTLVLELYDAALAELPEAERRALRHAVCLAPHGGYGRRDVAPYSDIDLMLLHAPAAAEAVVPLARRLVLDLNDAGLQLGFAVRTVPQACELARTDASVFTSLVESRYLAGSVRLLTQFARQFRRQGRRRDKRVLSLIDNARSEERNQYGQTVYLLEPNVKRSSGGLRDLQLLRWIGFARYGDAEPDGLERQGVLSAAERNALRKSSEFLLRLRNEMHFHHGKPYDLLDRAEQLRIAQLWGYAGNEGVLPVEQFMQTYFRHTSEVREIVGNFGASARRRSTLAGAVESLLSHTVDGEFWVGLTQVGANRRGLERIPSDLGRVLRLVELASIYDRRIEQATWEAIREAMLAQPDLPLSDEAKRRFLSFMGQGARLGPLLRGLHEFRVLEKIIPDMRHARCLLQFNEYHKYTVDEHCIRAVEAAAAFDGDAGPLGEAYRSIKHKYLLHLALLLHDLGKGYVEDHSELGAKIALATAARLNLPERETEMLRFLVHKHLLMAHLALRRDTSDDDLVVQFAVEVGSAEMLAMLYVHTCADLAAVGPNTLNQWKLDLLTELYSKARYHLTVGVASSDAQGRIQTRRAELRQAVASLLERRAAASGEASDNAHGETFDRGAWFGRLIDSLPPAYLYGGATEQIADDLLRLGDAPPSGAVAWGRYVPERGAVEYTIAAHEGKTHGIFHRLAGVLSGQGLEILAAEIHTLGVGMIFDRFYVRDGDFPGEPPAERYRQIAAKLTAVMDCETPPDPTFRRLWQGRGGRTAADLAILPTRVRIDNATSERHTIVDVFAHDRTGLLYTIARELFALGLSVHVAKLSTHLDQVVGVFYVVDEHDRKIEDETRIQEIRGRIWEAIANLSREGK